MGVNGRGMSQGSRVLDGVSLLVYRFEYLIWQAFARIVAAMIEPYLLRVAWLAAWTVTSSFLPAMPEPAESLRDLAD
jgi:hypothetical protein